MRIQRSIGIAVLGSALAVGAMGSPAHAACTADLINTGYGGSDECTDFANGAYVQIVRGRVGVQLYCNGVLFKDDTWGAGRGVLYSWSPACSAKVVLIARDPEGRSDAVVYMD